MAPPLTSFALDVPGSSFFFDFPFVDLVLVVCDPLARVVVVFQSTFALFCDVLFGGTALGSAIVTYDDGFSLYILM